MTRWHIITRTMHQRDGGGRVWTTGVLARIVTADSKQDARALCDPERHDQRQEVISCTEWDSLSQKLKDAVLRGYVENPDQKIPPTPRVR